MKMKEGRSEKEEKEEKEYEEKMEREEWMWRRAKDVEEKRRSHDIYIYIYS